MSDKRNDKERSAMIGRILGSERYERIHKAVRMPDTLPTMRRYFINTVFDSTFVVLGVIMGTALVADPQLRMVALTIVTSCVALSMSTGVSVYEGEKMEQRIRIMEIERAMLRRLDKSSIEKTSQISVMLISLVNAMAPWLAAVLTLLPFLLIPDITLAAWVAISAAICLLFLTGLMMGRLGKKRSPAFNGLRMALMGAIVFVLGTLIERAF